MVKQVELATCGGGTYFGQTITTELQSGACSLSTSEAIVCAVRDGEKRAASNNTFSRLLFFAVEHVRGRGKVVTTTFWNINTRHAIQRAMQINANLASIPPVKLLILAKAKIAWEQWQCSDKHSIRLFDTWSPSCLRCGSIMTSSQMIILRTHETLYMCVYL